MPRGSKPGERRGGRQKGTPNAKTAERIAKEQASGLMPLDFMIQVLRDENQSFCNRQWAAKESAPYLHARLSATEIKHSGELRFEAIKRHILDPRDSDASRVRPATGSGKV